MLARWYLLLGQCSVTFEYRPGAQHANADGMSRQCGQCQRPDCPVSAMDSPAPDAEQETELVDQPFAGSDPALIDSCLVRSAHCSWRRTSRARMLSGLRTRWRWHLIRSADTPARRYSDRNGCMISGRFDAYLQLTTG